MAKNDDSSSRTAPGASVSAIVATVDRFDPIVRLLDSLSKQTVPPLEVIFVDQNEVALPDTLIRAKNWPFVIRHCHLSASRGVSRARNVGLRQAVGEWVFFPDDDCWYPPDYIERSLAVARQSGADFVSGRPTDTEGRTINGRFAANAGPIRPHMVFTRVIEWNVLARLGAVNQLAGFDETISLGGNTPWQGGEGFDLLLRAIDGGFTCYYDPTIVAHHDELSTHRPDVAMAQKGRKYGRGHGRVLAKHGYGFHIAGYWVARSLFNLALSLLSGRMARARYFLQQATGRFEGWLGRTLAWPKYPRVRARPDTADRTAWLPASDARGS